MAPTIKATLIATIDGIASAQAGLSEEERQLQARRARLDQSMREALTALADLEAAAPAQAGDEGPPFVPALPTAARGTDLARLQVGPRRRYMAAAIKTCREIILAFGRPATMAEIHAAHPERERLPILALYKALEQRTRYARPSFLTKNGVFWVPDKPLPEGWIHPKGTPWAIVPMHYRFRGSKVRASTNADPSPKGYPTQATYLTPEERAEFNVGSAHELVSILNGVWSGQGRRALALGSFPTTRRKLEFVLTEARKARADGLLPAAPTE